MPSQYWHPDWWGVGHKYTIIANIGFAIDVRGKQALLDPREMLKTEQFKVVKSYYTDGAVTTIIQFL